MSDLYHHGIKGQKWGVKRKQARAAQKASVAREKSWKKDYINRDKISTADLKKKVERLRLENEMSRLVNDIPSAKRKKGNAFIKTASNIAVQAGTTVLQQYLKKNGADIGAKLIKKAVTG